MNERQYKKLCKKSAEIIGFDKCDKDSEYGIFEITVSVDHYGESDSLPVWDFIEGKFNGSVNTEFDIDSPCCISWKPEDEFTKATPANVFAWARKQEWR